MSGAICDEYLSDPRVSVIHQENRGLSGARNTGLDHATGEYIAFLDADDAFHPEMIAQLQDAKQRKVPGVKKEIILSARDTFIAMMKGNLNVAVWDKLYRRQLWENLRFPEGVVYEDLRTMPLLLTQCSRIAFIPQTLVYYRKREGRNMFYVESVLISPYLHICKTKDNLKMIGVLLWSSNVSVHEDPRGFRFGNYLTLGYMLKGMVLSTAY